MPSKSGKQHRLMAMVAHDPKAAKRLGIPQSVGKDYVAADKGKKFKEGGMAKTDKLKKIFKGKDTYAEEIKEAKAIKSGKITPREYAKGEKDIEKHKCGGKVKKYATGGETKAGKAMPEAKDMGALGLKKGGSCKPKKFFAGGMGVAGGDIGAQIRNIAAGGVNGPPGIGRVGTASPKEIRKNLRNMGKFDAKHPAPAIGGPGSIPPYKNVNPAITNPGRPGMGITGGPGQTTGATRPAMSGVPVMGAGGNNQIPSKLTMKKGGKVKKFAEGGEPTAEQLKEMRQQRDDKRQQDASQKAYDKIQGTDTKKPAPEKKYARGGGVEVRGKTKGRFI